MDQIKNQAPDSILAGFITQLDAMEAEFLPFYHNLSNDERTGIRTMAEGREGTVRAIDQIALANPNELSRKDDPMALHNKLGYDEKLEAVRQRLAKMTEYVEETQLTNSKDIMATADAFVASFQINRGRNSALDAALKPIDESNKKFGRSQKSGDDTTDTPVVPPVTPTP